MVKMILDLDTGIDDGMALAYAIGNPEIELIGVTGTYGNVYTEVGVQNVLNILNLCNAQEIPVFAGESHAMCKDDFNRLEVSARIHGANGVGQVRMEQSPKRKEKKNAVDFLIESAKKYGDELVIVATGPLTNLAMALKRAPEMKDIMGRVVIMGGALTIPGNVSPYTEANIWQDPEAAKYLFESGVDVTMVGLDVTQRSILTNENTRNWRNTGTLAGKTYADMIDYYISQHDEIQGCYLHDPSAVINALHPEFFTMVSMHMTVITQGEAVGRTIGNPQKLREANPNIKVCIQVDSQALVQHLNETLMLVFQNKS
ncbi:nucleoside hydrolase [Paenibacillus sp. IHBB 10380]|uniref:nucleoside hydrolase n=1 Tax=Paenibacillus sp. IHBB 10380 TaxID=1566358 RepID=UPI0005CFD5B7|nr:nucleoside hydrolase [Paenibacillus sp. IHBB 10380]AJS58622.1 nucleoside hydrolase [Paenibacillus sp. IHBB 10380]